MAERPPQKGGGGWPNRFLQAITIRRDIPETLLQKVEDREGRAFNLALLSLDVENLHIRSQARGMSTAMTA